jgi:hypothetical protein
MTEEPHYPTIEFKASPEVSYYATADEDTPEAFAVGIDALKQAVLTKHYKMSFLDIFMMENNG